MFDFFKNKLKQAQKQMKTVTRKSSLDKVKYFKEYMDDWLQEDYIVFNEEYSFFDRYEK